MKQRFLKCSIIAAVMAAIFSCAGQPPVNNDIRTGAKVSAVYLIHGDGNYTYHTPEGAKKRGDRRVLDQAKQVGENLVRGEVIIFHLKTREHIFFFPLADGTFYYYNGGDLIIKEKYSRREGRFDTELELLGKYFPKSAAPRNRMTRIFAYFGHQVPPYPVKGYHSSFPGTEYSLSTLAGWFGETAEALYRTPEAKPSDILILSTCNSGTPRTVKIFSPLAEWIIASPVNLHLSHMDTDPLLNNTGGDIPVKLAEKIFRNLSDRVLTEVAVSVYNTEKIRPFLEKYAGEAGEDEHPGDGLIIRPSYTDCAELEHFDKEEMNDGVTVFYRPPRFGQNKDKQTHSGWGCFSGF
ncbi:MAG: hypothetical protein ACLFST_14620 [Spirochaetia bacterium]